jgi:hypothetical protein
MTDSLYSKDEELEARARRILIEALQRAGIEEYEHHSREGFSDAYWWISSSVQEIEVTISAIHYGWLKLSLFPQSLASNLLQFRSDDEQATAALADALTYIKSITQQLLLETHQLLIARQYNLLVRRKQSSDIDLKAAYDLLGKPLREAIEKNRKKMEKQLAGELQTRGGSSPKLPTDQLKTLHKQYDGLKNLARKIKSDYNKTLKRFARERASRGYSRRQWIKRWRSHCEEQYKDETLREFAMMFVHPDAPSASNVAYQQLARITGYKASYLSTLVTDSRKLQKRE